ncbi:hypothetical protein EWM64_g6148 [Hericium alpestre]|uniref:Uricase n=1 Tax=Hericium alpestre TaxID=135208 RepID=A0A4Y9ZUZ9_9AGAM|nr:hypothetical protein EWM64_g6148 [Hericium alpestre]
MSTPTSNESGRLAAARYGKDKIRVFRVVREPAPSKVHHIVEYIVTALVEGDFDTSFTQADNSVVVATDSIKNITYYLAKTSPHVLDPTRFALHLGTVLVSKYAHLHRAYITVQQLRWARIDESGAPHTHAFWRDGDEKKVVRAEIEKLAAGKLTARVAAGLSDLLVLKTTGSAFENFVRDEFTTLLEVSDRIFSTSVDLTYRFKPLTINVGGAGDGLELLEEWVEGREKGSAWDGEEVAKAARQTTLEVFATDESASVQATLYKMGQALLAHHSQLDNVSYSLPNKHYIPVDMRYINEDNLTPLVAAPRFRKSLACTD